MIRSDDVFCGTASLTLPPPVLDVTRYCVLPGGTTIVTLPPPVLTWTSRGTWVKTISMSPPPVSALTWAAVMLVAWMLPPPVLIARSPDTRSAVTLPPPADRLTVPEMPSAVTLPPPVDTDTAVPPSTLTVPFIPQEPSGTEHAYPNASSFPVRRSVMCGRTRL